MEHPGSRVDPRSREEPLEETKSSRKRTRFCLLKKGIAPRVDLLIEMTELPEEMVQFKGLEDFCPTNGKRESGLMNMLNREDN